ncbi:hypothetical protein HK105_203293 [Polyrhizophydium stewartii]|uniref:Glutathione S-transferase n=1 Tax=Polyrhizophydium stewartii TaxID=2732419 RepID=A0ABR4NCH3_9FUNG|nr:hypothetical protein HK105_001878 [Polyrhizophydium stewartii]
MSPTPNETLGDAAPTLKYFTVPGNMGRGEVVRLFLHDAGIHFVDGRISFPDWPALKAQLIESEVNLAGSMPVFTVAGHHLAGHMPMLRLLSKKLGRYHGKTIEEDYFVDHVADVYIDWRASWVTILGGPEAGKKHIEEGASKYRKIFEKLLAKHEGPYVLGHEITYVDFAIYQVLNDEHWLDNNHAALADFPNLHKLADAIEARPNLAKYLEFRKQFVPK